MMKKFKMYTRALLKAYGTTVKVWDIALKPELDYLLVAPVDEKDWTETVEPEIRNEPFIPFPTTSKQFAFTGSIVAGGIREDYKSQFFSSKEYDIGSILEVKGKRYRITDCGDYSEYAGYFVYEAKGDNQHDREA